MADTKISGLPASTTPLAGTEVLPIVQSGVTKQVANNDLRPKQIQSNATSGVLQVAGPTTATTRVMTVPDANFTAARTDAAQTFSGNQTFSALANVTQITTNNFTGNMADGATYDISLNGDRSGIIVLREATATGYWVLYGFSTDDGNGTVVISKTPASTWGTAVGGVVGPNLYPSGSGLRIQNNSGGVRSFRWNFLTLPT